MNEWSVGGFAAVVIGRNEGQRLRRCIYSLRSAARIIYVDSGSTDGSVEWTRKLGIDVVELDMAVPFTAARARNAGFKRMRKVAPELEYVLFVDGDCEIHPDWPARATQFLALHPEIAAVCGRLAERYPSRSIYNWLCSKEWDRPPGELRACAGNVLMRADALECVGGYRDDVIAAEEDELSVRLRQARWLIWRIDVPMAVHDANMMHFRQWWRRSMRAGYAFAQGSYLHGAPPERHFAWETRRALFWGFCLPAICCLGFLLLGPWALLIGLTYPVQFVKQVLRNQGTLADRAILSWFQVLARFPESWGLAKFYYDLIGRRRPQIIEYKVIRPH